MEALGRQTFGPFGTLVYKVALGYVFLPFHGVTVSLSFNECWYFYEVHPPYRLQT